MQKAIVFFDQRCGLCNKEILFYKKKDTQNKIEWLDIHENITRLTEFNLNFDQAMKAFHFIDANKKMYVGVDAFIQIYKHLPKWQIAAKILSFPGIYHLASLGYILFSFLRYRAHGYHKCNI